MPNVIIGSAPKRETKCPEAFAARMNAAMPQTCMIIKIGKLAAQAMYHYGRGAEYEDEKPPEHKRLTERVQRYTGSAIKRA